MRLHCNCNRFLIKQYNDHSLYIYVYNSKPVLAIVLLSASRVSVSVALGELTFGCSTRLKQSRYDRVV